jgi:alcohol dehydrogenase (cytochrome c)
MKRLIIAAALAVPVLLAGQSSPGLDPAAILQPLAASWPTYSGDDAGRRYSALSAINRGTLDRIGFAWTTRFTAGSGPDGRGNGLPTGGRGGGAPVPIIVGGLGTGELNTGGPAAIRGSILMVDGTLYVSAPDNAWAVDARDGTVLWHYYWKTRGGTHTGHRGLGMWHGSLFMEMHDDYLVSLDAKTGHERWRREISDFDQQYFSSMAPVIVGDHVLVGTGDDLDAPGFLQSFDPETGALQWKFYTVPMKPGDPGLETWSSLDAARHGGAQVWVPGSYDPDTHLYIFGTGNPTPAYTVGRGEGDNLFTCSLVAVNVETGKMAWYFQTSPHDMHDWDSTQTPVLVDAPFEGRLRHLVLTATRNGYFFVLDRVTGEHLVTTKFGSAANWALGIDEKGRPTRNPAKDATIPGSIVTGSTTNWPPPAFSPDTGLFYVPENNSYSIFYLMDPDPRGSMGLGGTQSAGVASAGNFITAIDYRTGKAAWRHELLGGGGATGLLATAGGLVFAGDGAGNLVGFDAATGEAIWHARIGTVSNAPETYELDGRQYLLAAAGDGLFAFVLNDEPR